MVFKRTTVYESMTGNKNHNKVDKQKEVLS